MNAVDGIISYGEDIGKCSLLLFNGSTVAHALSMVRRGHLQMQPTVSIVAAMSANKSVAPDTHSSERWWTHHSSFMRSL